MSERADNNQYVRRVVLPSGKTIEVVYFEEHPATSAPSGTALESASDLHVCVACESGLVYPMEWEEAGATHWEVSLRCPNCEWYGGGVYGQDVVERFDEELDRGTEALVRDLKRLRHANLEDEIARFVTALHGGHIVPDDF
jgi:hypothetical protein